MAVFSVDSDAILTANGQALATAERLRAETAALSAQLLDLQSAWTGSAAVAFQGTLDQWKATQRAVEDTLDGIGRLLGAAGAQYADTERTAAGMFR
ncbi:type VII secretion protein [Microbacterium sp. Root53]|uniref:WXG100 family type VII secretion target n=1 Tax=Microbacterium sp. Root53 TaxID=1736553 RepID=UPI0006F4C17D|nr:WXG100 family type VII secretion target [Microbacterium sp. Root53]KQZ06023.1 type VII secretion protein [Microbacterium sp. Root53]